MIGKVWDMLFEKADHYKKEYGADSAEVKVIREIEDGLQEIWDYGERFATALDVKPKNKSEAIAVGVGAIARSADGEVFYELEGHHLDTASDVISYIVQDRQDKYTKLKNSHAKKYIKLINEYQNSIDALEKELNRVKKLYADYKESKD